MSELEKVNTEEKILEVAKRVFVRRGFNGTRMQEIADEAGINKALLHYYYRSKERLFFVIFEELLDILAKTITDLINSTSDIYELIDKFVDFYTEFLKKNPHMPIFILNEIYQNPERMKERLSKSGNFPKAEELLSKLNVQMANGEIKTFNLIYFIINMISMCIFPFIAQPLIQSVFQVGDAMYDFMLDDRKEFIKETLINSIKV